MNSLIQKLERGRESCHQIINMLQELKGSSSLSSSLDHHHQQQLYDDHQGDNNGVSYLKLIDGNCKVVQTTLDDVLFMLRNYDFIEDVINMRRPKVSRTDINDSPNNFSKFEDKFDAEIPKPVTPPKDRRGCYKRRRNEQARVMETMNLSDDGHAWRKYGQKIILHSTHPRNYYRCTHKHDEGCQATKQVQQISENPRKYRIIYHGQHTCKAPNILNNNPAILFDCIHDNQNSSILLSFDTPKQPLNYSFMFSTPPPPPPPTSSSTPSSSSSSSGVAMLTVSSIKEEVIIASEPLNSLAGDGTRSKQYTSPSPDQYIGTPSTDVTAGTTITAVSDNLTDVISSTELYSPVSSVHDVDTYECYSNILADDLINLDVLYDQPNL